jgi:hypothetical protein
MHRIAVFLTLLFAPLLNAQQSGRDVKVRFLA